MQNVVYFYRHHVGNCNCVQISRNTLQKAKYLPKFLYAINKGIDKDNLRKYPYSVNDSIKNEQRRIPFGNMIYIGDGPNDIPCFSAVRSNDGHCIGIMDAQNPKRAYELARGRRTNYGMYSNNYLAGSDLRLMLENIINEIARKSSC